VPINLADAAQAILYKTQVQGESLQTATNEVGVPVVTRDPIAALVSIGGIVGGGALLSGLSAGTSAPAPAPPLPTGTTSTGLPPITVAGTAPSGAGPSPVPPPSTSGITSLFSGLGSMIPGVLSYTPGATSPGATPSKTAAPADTAAPSPQVPLGVWLVGGGLGIALLTYFGTKAFKR
jgi:hypothetical protein